MPRPNILLFMPDQQRTDCIGCFGNPAIHTPNIDALAARGMRFDNAWVNHPVCSPSRVNFMTSWYPHTRGHRTLTHLVQSHEPNFLRYMKDGGYHVAWAGNRGDVFAPGVTEASTHFAGWTTKRDGQYMGPQYDEGSPLYNTFYNGRRTGSDTWIDFDEATTRTALDWLRGKPRGPFCLWMPLIFPHLPFEVEEPWYSLHDPTDLPRRISDQGTGKPAFHAAIRERYGTDRVTEDEWAEIIRTYYGMVSRVDSQLGRVVQVLDEIGELDNTIIVYFTDHGEYIGDFGLVEKWPSGLDRCLLQNPVIMAGPGIPAGTTAATFTEMIDIAPTLMEIAGVTPDHTHFGRSLVPLFSDPNAVIRDRAFSEGGFALGEMDLLETASGVYRNKAELQHEQPHVVGKAISMRTADYTYVYRLYEDDELYDRQADPSETRNLVHDPTLADTATKLKSELLAWLFETSDVIPWAADPRFPKVPQGQHEEFHWNPE